MLWGWNVNTRNSEIFLSSSAEGRILENTDKADGVEKRKCCGEALNLTVTMQLSWAVLSRKKLPWKSNGILFTEVILFYNVCILLARFFFFFLNIQQEDAFRKKKPQEKKEGNVPNMNWNRNRTSRKNKKKNVNISTRYVLPHQVMKKSRIAVIFPQGFVEFCIVR